MVSRTAYVKNLKRIVIKVGTTTLTHESGLINLSRMEKLVRFMSDLHNEGYEIVLVTSGAIGAGMGKLNLTERPRTIPEKQAVAAVGQVALIHMYQKIFSEYGKTVAQLLLTKEDISSRTRFLNARNAFFSIFSQKVIPIVNENDAVAIDEIKVGDNDTLSALVSSLIDADLLIILSDIDGLYTANPKEVPDATLIDIVENIDSNIKKIASGSGSKFGTGGMATKIKAAEICTSSGINMVIAKGEDPEIIRKIVKGENIGTLFIKNDKKLSARKHWIIYGSKKSGKIVVDTGASKAICQHKSLLPSGIIEIVGTFKKGDIVSILDEEFAEIARGIVNYSSHEVDKIKGCQTSDISNILGYKDYDVVVHLNNMHILGGF